MTSEFTELTSVLATDMGVVIDDPAGSPELKKATWSNIFNALTQSGNVGIGTANPQDELHVKGTGQILRVEGAADPQIGLYEGATQRHVFWYDTTNNNMVFSNNEAGSGIDFNTGESANAMKILSTGNVGIGMTPTVQFELSGAVGQKASGTTWANPSDSRLKKDIILADLARCYEIVKAVPLKRYTLKDDVFSEDKAKDRSKLGWIADDVKHLFPKATPVVPFTLPTQIPDGDEEYQEQESVIEKIEETSIEIIAGKPVQVIKIIEKERLLFDAVEVVDETGKVVMKDGEALTYPVPRMITKTRPKFRQEVIEDCLTLDADQIYAAMYGALQLLMAKVEALEGTKLE